MSELALSALFEYLYYGPTAIIMVYSFSAGIDFRRQNLKSLESDTSKVDPRADLC